MNDPVEGSADVLAHDINSCAGCALYGILAALLVILPLCWIIGMAFPTGK